MTDLRARVILPRFNRLVASDSKIAYVVSALTLQLGLPRIRWLGYD